MKKVRFASVWLGGCAGCHMSLLDIDEWVVELSSHIDVVYSPVADVKQYPQGVDVCLVEGAVANEHNLELIREIRLNTATLIALGDCAINTNVPGMRNRFSAVAPLYDRAYSELCSGESKPLDEENGGVLPVLLKRVLAVNEAVPVDYFIPGCPPPADRIRAVLEFLLKGEKPLMAGKEMLQFG